MKVEEKLALNKFEIDREVHIRWMNQSASHARPTVCVYVCPAECYVLRDGHITFSYEGCLECGSCRMPATRGR